MRRWVSSDAYREIIRALVGARIARGMTQRDVAAALGKPPSFVAKIEVGERRLDVLEFIAICRAAGVNPAELLALIDEALPGQLEV